MGEGEGTEADPAWRSLVGAIPGGVGVQRGDEFDYVSEEFAAAVGVDADALAGESWRTLFDPRQATLLERTAVERARDDGTWTGVVRTGGRAVESAAVDVTLSAVDGDVLLWLVGDRDPHARTGPDEDRSGRPTRALPGFVRTVLDAVDDVLYVIDESGEFYLWNDALAETTGYAHEDIAGMRPLEFVPEDQHEYVPGLMDAVDAIGDRRVEVDVLARDGERITHEFTGTTFEDPRTGAVYRCGLARDVTERKERERALERQRDELATLDRINELLLETVRELIASASREAVERTICERLAASDLYRFAWVGERAPDGDRVVPRTSAGEGRGYLDAVTITVDGSETGADPVGRAIRTGEVQAADAADPAFEPRRDAAVERGFESVAAVPLGRGDSVYGVLVVYATREDAFSPRERAGFDVLGRTVGLVVRAARSRDLLFADAVVELEFRVADADSVFVSAAAEHDCELSLDGYVASGDRWICYVGVEGTSPAAVATAARDGRVERARVVSDDGDAGRIEVVLGGPSLLHAITAAGATLRDASADADGARLVVEAPATVDTRTVVERVRDRYPTAELVARRERDREVTTVGRPGGVLDALTERQREALETAYRAGYFDWPRASTAEAVADALDLAPATLHGHLRKAERAILSALLDGGRDADDA